MKKNYQKPTVRIHQMNRRAALLSGSGEDEPQNTYRYSGEMD